MCRRRSTGRARLGRRQSRTAQPRRLTPRWSTGTRLYAWCVNGVSSRLSCCRSTWQSRHCTRRSSPHTGSARLRHARRCASEGPAGRAGGSTATGASVGSVTAGRVVRGSGSTSGVARRPTPMAGTARRGLDRAGRPLTVTGVAARLASARADRKAAVRPGVEVRVEPARVGMGLARRAPDRSAVGAAARVGSARRGEGARRSGRDA
mmetsp:Transcript_27409/g.87136  ORF Transcript_27409/g.87136 Transcript_27409/m.87136 type:complete len:207 (-) Transcript_27409:85-705(-)